MNRCGMSLGRVARPVVFGSFAAAMVVGVAGCSAFREQWPSRRLAREYKPRPEQPAYYAPEVDQTTYNAAALNGLPLGVQSAFRSEHPDAAVTAVNPMPSGAGLTIYRVAFVEDGAASAATYRAGGRDVQSGSTSIIRQHDDSGRPAAKFAPATQPSQQTNIEVLAPAAPAAQ
jgi:hypothetical protein